jgi:hypothetical protein
MFNVPVDKIEKNPEEKVAIVPTMSVTLRAVKVAVVDIRLVIVEFVALEFVALIVVEFIAAIVATVLIKSVIVPLVDSIVVVFKVVIVAFVEFRVAIVPTAAYSEEDTVAFVELNPTISPPTTWRFVSVAVVHVRREIVVFVALRADIVAVVD